MTVCRRTNSSSFRYAGEFLNVFSSTSTLSLSLSLSLPPVIGNSLNTRILWGLLNSFYPIKTMNSSALPENEDTAIAAAADVAWANLARTIGNRNLAPAEVRAAVLAVYGIRWNRAVLRALTTDRINRDHARLRNSDFPEQEYGRLSAFLKDAYAASSAFPVELLEWRTLAAQISLDMSAGWEAVLQTAIFLRAQGMLTPFRLGVLSPAEFFPLSEIPPNAALFRPDEPSLALQRPLQQRGRFSFLTKLPLIRRHWSKPWMPIPPSMAALLLAQVGRSILLRPIN